VDGETVEGIDVVHYGEQQHLAWRRLLERHSCKKIDCVSFDKYNVEQNTSVPLVLKGIMSPVEYFFEGLYIRVQ
jgi:hypothetical protein